MKEELNARLTDLQIQYEKMEAERQSLFDKADKLREKMLFVSGAFEEIKLLIKKHYPECEQEAK